MAKTSVKEVLNRAIALEGVRLNWESYWQDVLYYCIPRKAYITRTKIEGQRLPVDVYDSAAIEALRIFAAGLAGYMTNPSAKWFNLRTENRDLMDTKKVKVWLKDSEDKIYDTLNGSNFNTSIHEGYLDFGSVGMMTIFIEKDPVDYVRFYTRPIKEISIDQNDKEIIDTVFREFKYTVRQAYQRWGNDVSKETKKKYEDKKYDEKITIIHCVAPRFDYNPGKKDNLNMPFKSVYVEKDAKKKLSESGFGDFPYAVAGANKESGELYFTSPMMECFSDTKMVNQMTKTNLRAGMKAVDAPLDVPHDGFINQLNLNPSAVNYRNPGTPGDNNEVRPIGVKTNVPLGFELIDRVERKIQRALFVDLFLALQQRDPKKTATEVLAMAQERMLLLGPMLGRLTGLYSHIIKRTFAILQERGIILPLPVELLPDPKDKNARPKNLIVEYVSPLAKAQKGSDLRSMQTMIALVGPVAEALPQVLDKIDGDKWVDEVADLTGVNPELIRDKTGTKAIRDARATAAEAVKKMEMLKAGVEIAKTGSEAVKNTKEKKK